MDEWCSCSWNASANVEAKHLGCYIIHVAKDHDSDVLAGGFNSPDHFTAVS